MVTQICRGLTLQVEPDLRRLLDLQRRRTARCQRLGRRHTPAQGVPAQRETLLLRYVARHRIHDGDSLPASERQGARPHPPPAAATLQVMCITPRSARPPCPSGGPPPPTPP